MLPTEVTEPGRMYRTVTLGAPIIVIATLITTGMLRFVPTIAQLGALSEGGGFLLIKFLTAILLIIVTANIGGWVASLLRQPRVVGEMTAGIMLGPSLLGQLWPAAESWLFPTELMPHLDVVAQLAVIAFVFMFGASLRLDHLHGSGLRVTVLGLGMVAVPVGVGILVASLLAADYRPAAVSQVSFLLFVGVAMGVTAFPVLVRILAEHGLTTSRVGTMGLAAAGIDDAIAWCLLAVAVATVRHGSPFGAAWTVLLLVIFAAAVWMLLRPALRHFLDIAKNHRSTRAASVPVLGLAAVSGAFITDWIGVHAIFGAFLVGMAMPREDTLVQRLAQLTDRGVAVVLPLFFAVVGLSVRVDLLADVQGMLVCGLVVLAAVGSKLGATTLIARLTRLGWRESAALGVMVNCRGLTGLVVVSTGLSLGIIGEDLFVMFVIMALVTTIMTGPLLQRLRLDQPDEGIVQPAEPAGKLAPTAAAPG